MESIGRVGLFYANCIELPISEKRKTSMDFYKDKIVAYYTKFNNMWVYEIYFRIDDEDYDFRESLKIKELSIYSERQMFNQILSDVIYLIDKYFNSRESLIDNIKRKVNELLLKASFLPIVIEESKSYKQLELF